MTQLTQFKAWNTKYKLGFTEKEIKALGKQPEGAVLSWCLPSLGKTLEKKVEILKTKLDFYWVNDNLFDDKKVRLLQGKPSKKLEWVVLNTKANQGKPPDTCTDQNLAGYELLDLACQSPERVKEMDGEDYPYWNLGAVQVDPDRAGSFGRVAYLYWLRGRRDVPLDVGDAGRAAPDWSVPVRESELGARDLDVGLGLEARVEKLETVLENVRKALG